MPRSRKLIPISSSVVEELASIARRVGMTLPELVDTILSNAVRVLRGQGDAASALAESIVLSDVRRLGLAPAPLDALAMLLEKADDSSYRLYLNRLRSAAEIAASAARERGMDPSDALRMLLQILLSPMAVDSLVERGGGRVIVASTLLANSKRMGEIVATVIEAVASQLGYKTMSIKIEPGVVVADLKLQTGEQPIAQKDT